MIYILLILLVALALVLGYYMHAINRNIQKTIEILSDVQKGNLDRKLIIKDSLGFKEISYQINEITAKYKHKIVELESSEKTYKSLITSLSHDVRTPITSLIGYLNLINDTVDDEIEKEKYLELCEQKAYVLKQYVDTLFEWLKLESKERIFSFEKVDICELTREIFAKWIPLLEENKLDYEISIPQKEVFVKLDQDSYVRIIENLMQNIFSHSNATMVQVTISQSTSFVNVKVMDNGIGIEKKELPHIFQRLYKCNPARNNTGSGLGLAIVAELIKANAACIEVESEINKGCCFTMKFPQQETRE